MRRQRSILIVTIGILAMSPLVQAESREERQARSIEVLRAGVLARPTVELPPSREAYREPVHRSRSREVLVADDVLFGPVVVERFYYVEPGYYPPQRVLVPPVTHHVSRSSRQVYSADRSPHGDRSTAIFVRSWGARGAKSVANRIATRARDGRDR